MSDHGGPGRADRRAGRDEDRPPAAVSLSAAQRRAEVLGDLVNGRPEHVAEAVPELAAILDGGGDEATIRAVVEALGHVGDDRALLVLLAADLTAHPSPGVRLALAQALGGGLSAPEVRAGAVEQLLRLVVDSAPGVPDWACFGLGELYADGALVRDVLAGRLDDRDGDTRDEALVALARTGDLRAVARVRQVLAVHDEREVSLLQLQAAVELAAPDLLPVLDELAQEWAGDDDEYSARLDRARRRSAPDAAARAAALERQLVKAVNERLAVRDQAIYLTAGYPRTTLHFRTEPSGVGWWRRLWQDNDPDTFDLAFEVDNWILNAPRALEGRAPDRRRDT